MTEAAKTPVKVEKPDPVPASGRGWSALEGLRREIDRLFDNVHRDWGLSLGRPAFDFAPLFSSSTLPVAPAVDVADKEAAYEITAELPGMDEKDIEVKLSNGVLTIKGEKKEEKEEKRKDYYMSERRFGSFQRSFRVPDGVDAEKVGATFAKGVLSVTLPKTAEARTPEKKIAIKAAA